MKALLVLFVIYVSHVTCENSKHADKPYPKKVRPYGNGKILIHSGKFNLYKTKSDKPPLSSTTRTYTVFQLVGNAKTIQGVPDSPYFPVDQNYDHKTRVKKVLPDYVWSGVRHKRSAEDKEIVTLEVKEEEKKDETTKEKPEEVKEKDDSKVEKTTVSIKKKEKETKEVKTDNPKKKEDAKGDQPVQRAHEDEPSNDKKKDESKTTKTDNPEGKKSVSKSNKNADTKLDDKKEESDKTDKVDKEVKSDKPEKSEISEKSVDKTVTSNSTDVKPTPKDAVTNVKGKKTTVSRGKRVTKKKKGKKQKRKTSGKGKKPKSRDTPQRKKKRAQKGGKAKPKQTNGTRTKSPKAARRLIGAREALIEDYPYVVSIQKDDEHWCAGAILNPRLVITTANCLWKANRLSRMEVRGGSRHTDRGGQLAAIQEVMKHPGWGLRKNPDNDVALILIDRPFKFSDSCHGVDLPNHVMMPPFEDAWVTSWGAERRDGVYDKDTATMLQVYHNRLMDHGKCNNITRRFGVLTSENFICLTQRGMAAPCTRDTGAPAVSDGILWGLASWGIRKLCGTERFPAMFSYIASPSNLDFITNSTHALMSDQRFYPFADRYPIQIPDSESEEEGPEHGDYI